MTAPYVAFESPAELDAPAVLYAWSRPFRYVTPMLMTARPPTTFTSAAGGPATGPVPGAPPPVDVDGDPGATAAAPPVAAVEGIAAPGGAATPPSDDG